MTIRTRPALDRDTPAMLSITRDIWEGHDYLPLVWDAWLSDPSGYLMTAEEGNDVLGFQHIEVQDDGTAWLEGIRVSESARGRGVGGLMLEHGLTWARDRGCPRARLSTWSANPASNRLAERAGMRLVSSRIVASGSVAGSEPAFDGVRVASIADEENVWHFLASHAIAPGSPYTEGWTAFSLTAKRMAALLARGAVVLSGDGAIKAAAIATASVPRPTLKLGLLVGSPGDAEAIARWLRNASGRALLDGVRATIDGRSADSLRSAGYEIEEGAGMNVWETSL